MAHLLALRPGRGTGAAVYGCACLVLHSARFSSRFRSNHRAPQPAGRRPSAPSALRGLHRPHPVPTAWDYVFSHSTGSWVLVTLADGSTVAGIFSARSFASSDAAERDLFLEQLYRVEDDGPWQPVPMNRGVWIRGEAIRAIEFLQFQE
ncbi:MAG TPA: DUF6338 family protein [Methylomirabilota bacterium]|nr:DUF6338 family protein [Methylomirabilota bacterium]